MLPCPPELQLLARALLAEEVASVVRHAVRNKLAAIRNSVFYIQRKVEHAPSLGAGDARLPQFFQLIDQELTACDEAVRSRLPPHDPSSARPVVATELVCLLVNALQPPAGVRLEAPGPAPHRVEADPSELMLALYCLLANAVDATEAAGGGAVRLSCDRLDPGRISFEVVDHGEGLPVPAVQLTAFFTSRPGRTGLGLSMARRIAARWGGSVELGPGPDRGVRASLLIPASSSQVSR